MTIPNGFEQLGFAGMLLIVIAFGIREYLKYLTSRKSHSEEESKILAALGEVVSQLETLNTSAVTHEQSSKRIETGIDSVSKSLQSLRSALLERPFGGHEHEGS